MINLISNPDLCGHLLQYIPSNELDRVFQLNRVTEAAIRYLRPQVKESYESRKSLALNTYRWLESTRGLRKFAALLEAKFLTVEEIGKLLAHTNGGIEGIPHWYLNRNRTEVDPNALIIGSCRAILNQTMLLNLTTMLGNSYIFKNAKNDYPGMKSLRGQARVQWYVQNIFNRLTQTEKAGLKALIDDSVNKRVPFLNRGGDTPRISNFYLTNGGRSRCPQNCNISVI